MRKEDKIKLLTMLERESEGVITEKTLAIWICGFLNVPYPIFAKVEIEPNTDEVKK